MTNCRAPRSRFAERLIDVLLLSANEAARVGVRAARAPVGAASVHDMIASPSAVGL